MDPFLSFSYGNLTNLYIVSRKNRSTFKFATSHDPNQFGIEPFMNENVALGELSSFCSVYPALKAVNEINFKITVIKLRLP